jgi:hypothetical protein
VRPTVFREAGLRFYFFSREEERPHIHVQGSDGEATRAIPMAQIVDWYYHRNG